LVTLMNLFTCFVGSAKRAAIQFFMSA